MPLSASTLLQDRAALQKAAAMLPHAVSLVLVVALAWTLANIGWQLLAPQQPAVAPGLVTPTTGTASKPRFSVSDITRRHLFGKESSAPLLPVQTKTPVSKLNLTLRGVLAAEPSNLSTAIISAGKGKSGREEIYAVGDTIQNGVKLHEVHGDHVIIDRQGRLEKLVMPEDKGGEVSLTRASATGAPGRSASLGDIRKQIMSNPTSFGEYALPIVVKQNGKQVGYRLKPQKKGELLSQYGLQPSDIITEINGVKLDNPQNGIQALRELSTAGSVDLMLKRGNSFVPLNIQLQ